MSGGAVFRCGARRGLVSRAFSPASLERAALLPPTTTVWMEVDAQGYLVSRGAGGSAGGCARAAASARLAPHVHAANVLLTRAAPGAGALCLRVERAPAPHDELLLWFHEELAAAIDLPFLTLRNIRGRREYVCHECGARFEEPNPLKTHLLVGCAPAEPARLWRRVRARLDAAAAPSSAFRRVARDSAPAQDAWAARLEAAAAEWGRSRGGHACLYCGKLYSRKYGLKIHLRTHTGYRPLRCSHCARAFGDPSNLNKHERLHAGGRGAGGGHACARCGKPLARRRDLERHLRAHCTAPPDHSPLPSSLAPTLSK